MVLTPLRQFCHLYGGRSEAPMATRHIPEEFTGALRAHGLGRPVSSLDDPRLEDPELLLLHGYQCVTVADGEAYQALASSNHHQTIVFGADGSLRISSRCGQRIHDLDRSPAGDIRQTVCQLQGVDLLA